MAAWNLLKNKQTVTILLWYVTSMFVYSSSLSVFQYQLLICVIINWCTIGQVALFLSTNNFVFNSWIICRCLLNHWKIQTDTVQLMGSMDNSDHVYLHQCNVGVLWHCSVDSIFAFLDSLYILYVGTIIISSCVHTVWHRPTSRGSKWSPQCIRILVSHMHVRASFGCTDSVDIKFLFAFSL